MSNSISILLRRNLDVFGENDPARRRAVIDEIFAEDCVFYDPNNGIYRGRDEIDRIAGAIKGTRQMDGRVAPGNCSPEAPTDPDVRDYRIRLFGPRFRYVTVEERIRGCGSG